MDYDIAIIGAGWAGFNAALKAKELGLKTCLIEMSEIGGTCLNRGCIPTKSLIQSAKAFNFCKKAVLFGVEAENLKINFLKAQEKKDRIIQQLRQGMRFMLGGIDLVNKRAQLVSNKEIRLEDKTITSKHILIATGSRPVELPAFKFDGKKIISSDDILNLKEAPASLLIIGGGVIGSEFASLFLNLGSKITIVEKMPQLLLGLDKEAAKKIEVIFKKKGIKVNTDTDAATINLADYDLVLVCVGRTPKTEGLGLENLGIKQERAKIIVDEYLRTSVENIYAAGDCTGKMYLAHFAAYQGLVAAENIANQAKPKKADNTTIPSCIFTEPEISTVGLSQDYAQDKGMDIEVRKFDFLGSGMARIIEETEGFIKVVNDKKTGIIIGASIIGPKATELISVFGVAVQNHLTVSQIKDTIFAHPSLAESIHEALK